MPVPDVDRYRPDDKRLVEALYRRVFGTDAADASRLRWDWQYRRNPNNPGNEPEIWVAREHLHLTGTFRRLPGPIPGWLRESALTQDVVIGNMEYVLR